MHVVAPSVVRLLPAVTVFQCKHSNLIFMLQSLSPLKQSVASTSVGGDTCFPLGIKNSLTYSDGFIIMAKLLQWMGCNTDTWHVYQYISLHIFLIRVPGVLHF